MDATTDDAAWLEQIRNGEDAGWKRVWHEAIEPETRNARNAEMMRRFSLTDGDLNGMLFDEMIGRGKLDLYRGEGSLAGWLRRYVRGYILNADPNRHGEISIEGAYTGEQGESEEMVIPTDDQGVLRKDVWKTTHYCFHDLWQEDPERAYIHLLKTRFHLSSEEVRDFLDVSSAANVDQIFSRNVKYLRSAWHRHD